MISVFFDGRFEVGREGEPLLGDVLLQKVGESRFIDRAFALLERLAAFCSSISTQMTSLPLSAKQVPTTSPT